jgi:predicted DCC family thiol-disulfide oxidoreductase YuxK
MNQHTTITVLYDGGCPLCSREINHYRRIASELPIEWVDVTLPEVDLGRFDLTREEALRLFHVVDASGTMQMGAKAFIALWAVLPGYRWLAKLCRGLRIAPLLERIYVRFAGWHYRRRCPEGSCGISPEPPRT